MTCEVNKELKKIFIDNTLISARTRRVITIHIEEHNLDITMPTRLVREFNHLDKYAVLVLNTGMRIHTEKSGDLSYEEFKYFMGEHAHEIKR